MSVPRGGPSAEIAAGLTYLRDRLLNADSALSTMAATATGDREKARLAGKSEGVRLALSYLDEMRRTTVLPPAPGRTP